MCWQQLCCLFQTKPYTEFSLSKAYIKFPVYFDQRWSDRGNCEDNLQLKICFESFWGLLCLLKDREHSIASLRIEHYNRKKEEKPVGQVENSDNSIPSPINLYALDSCTDREHKGSGQHSLAHRDRGKSPLKSIYKTQPCVKAARQSCIWITV